MLGLRSEFTQRRNCGCLERIDPLRMSCTSPEGRSSTRLWSKSLRRGGFVPDLGRNDLKAEERYLNGVDLALMWRGLTGFILLQKL